MAVSLIWAVPVIAAVISIVLVVQNLKKFGPLITIKFADASGLDANQTVIRYRGVRVGSVKSIALTPGLRQVSVVARLDRSAASLARDGSEFWIVRPEVGAAGVHALETIVSGPYIEALPGPAGRPLQKEFIGDNEPPVITEPDGGREFVLHTTQIRSLGASSPVYFRGLPAGQVQYLDLSPDSKMVNVHIVVKPNFASLVRSNSVWWNAGGIDVTWHLLSGLNVAAENLRAVVTGGIAFNTPNDDAGPAPAGMSFELRDKPEEKWIQWSPAFNLTNTPTASAPGNTAPIDLENINQPPKPQ
jgi:paraquat-inducible protein B